MSRTQLSSSEIQDLINKYSSEEKKLEYQIAEVRATIDELSGLLQNVVGREQSALTVVKRKPKKAVAANNLTVPVKGALKGKRGRPRKSASVVAVKAAKSGRVSKSKKAAVPAKTGYKLSQWDQLVISSISDKGKVVITQEIIDYVKGKMNVNGKSVSDAEVKNKVTRSLQKLANRRGDLKKVAYKGKGYAYALPAWLDVKGKLDKKFKR